MIPTGAETVFAPQHDQALPLLNPFCQSVQVLLKITGFVQRSRINISKNEHVVLGIIDLVDQIDRPTTAIALVDPDKVNLEIL